MRKSDGVKKHFDFLLIDLLSLFISFFVSYRIKFGNFGFHKSEVWLLLVFLIILIDAVICLFSDPYKHIITRPYYEEILRSLILSAYNLIAVSVIFYIFKIGTVFSRQTVLLTFIFYFFLSLIFKCFWKWLIKSGKVKPLNAKKANLLIVTDNSDIEDILHNVTAGDYDEYEINAICLPENVAVNAAAGVEILNGFDKISQYAVSNDINDIFVFAAPGTIAKEEYEKLIKNEIGIHFGTEKILDFAAEKYESSEIGIYKTLSVSRYELTQGQMVYLGVKRLIDIIAGILGVIILIPVSAAVKIIYLLSGDKSKIIYRQNRVGKNGKEIKIFKFRTMVPDADKMLDKLLENEKYRAEWEANQKLNDDPRITKPGRFLRKTSLDELPQLINVLKGDMSVVGPRPLVEGELEAHGGMKLYQQIKPGITGWWGCNGRSNIDYRERLELEYYYIRNFSVYLDFLCVLRTVLSVIKRSGAE